MSAESLAMHEFAWDPSTDFDQWRSALMESGWLLNDEIPHRVAEDGFFVYSFTQRDAMSAMGTTDT